MTEQEKQLLLKDLCARLPYNTLVSVAEGGIDGLQWDKVALNFYLLHQIEEEDSWKFVKPYLRPMSSMTEEEKEKYYTFQYKFTLHTHEYQELNKETFSEFLNWLLENHFDYNGLIPKNLAIDCTGLNIY